MKISIVTFTHYKLIEKNQKIVVTTGQGLNCTKTKMHKGTKLHERTKLHG